MKEYTGKDLVDFCSENKVSRKELCKRLGISSRTLYSLMHPSNLNKKLPTKYSSSFQKLCEPALSSSLQVEKLLDNVQSHVDPKSLSGKISETQDVYLSLQESGSDQKAHEKVNEEFEHDFETRVMQKIPDDIKIIAYALFLYFKDEDVHILKKGISVGGLLYLISPIDAIPDLTPFVGFLDDIGVLISVSKYLSSDKFYEKAKNEAEKILKEKSWIS